MRFCLVLINPQSNSMNSASLLQDIEFHESKPVVTVLFETSFTKEIRIAMKASTEMKKHQASFPIVVEIVEGNIVFGVQNEKMNLGKGDLIALESSIPHDLKALKDSIIRLTLSKNDQSERVQTIASA